MNGLGNLFGGSQEESGLDALKYSAPKESQKRAAENSVSPSAAQKSTSASVSAGKSSGSGAAAASNFKFSASIYLYKGGSNGYDIVDANKLGCVVMGGGVDYKILVYNAQKAPQAVITLSELFTYSIRDLYLSCCDADGNQFSLLFDNVTALTKFIKVIMSITCSLSSQKNSTNIIKGILPSSASQSNSDGNATTLAAGMTAGVSCKIWFMESTSDVSTLLEEAPVFTMGSQDDVNKMKVLGMGDLASDVGGIGQSLVGLRKGDVVCLGLPASVASQGTKDLGSFSVNLSRRFLMVIVEVFKVKSERKEKKEKKEKKAVDVQEGGLAEPTNSKEAFAKALNDKLSTAPVQSALRHNDSAYSSNHHVHFSGEEEVGRGSGASANASASSYDDPSSASMQVTLTSDTNTRSYYESDSPVASNSNSSNAHNNNNSNGNPYENNDFNRNHSNNSGGGGGYPFSNSNNAGYGNTSYGSLSGNNNPNSPYVLMDVQKSVQQVHAKLDWMNDALQRLHNSGGGGSGGPFAPYGRQNIQVNNALVSGFVSGDPIDAQIESIVAALQMVSSEHSKSGDADQLRDLQNKISDLQDRNEKLMSEKEGMLTKHADMLNLGAESNKQMLSLQQEINSLRLQASKVSTETPPDVLTKIKTLEDELNDKHKSISNHVESAASMESELVLLGTKLSELTVEIENRENQVSELESQVGNLQEECGIKDDAVGSLSSRIEDLNERIAQLESEAVEKDAKLAENVQTNTDGEECKEEEIEEKDQRNDKEKDKEIEELKDRIAQLESEMAEKAEKAENAEKGETVEKSGEKNPPAKEVLQDIYASVIALFDSEEDSSYTTTQVIKGIKKICKTIGNKYSKE